MNLVEVFAANETKSVTLTKGNHEVSFTGPTAKKGTVTRRVILTVSTGTRAQADIPTTSGWAHENNPEGKNIDIENCSNISGVDKLTIGYHGSPIGEAGYNFVTTLTGNITYCSGAVGVGPGESATNEFTLEIKQEDTIAIKPNPANVCVDHWTKLTAYKYVWTGSENTKTEVDVDWSHVEDVDFKDSEEGAVMNETQVNDYEGKSIWAKSSVADKYTVRATSLGDSEEGGGVVIEGVLNVVNADLDSDINNDGEIDDDDEAGETTELGEIVFVDKDAAGLDPSSGEDDLQLMELTFEPSDLGQGVAWFTYDSDKVQLYKDDTEADTSKIDPGTEASPNWDLESGDTIPDEVYVRGLESTEEGGSIEIEFHWKKNSAEFTDKILTTVTDQVGHYAFFAGVRDYLTEYRGPGATDFKLFEDVVDASGGGDKDFRLVAVELEKVQLSIHDAYSPSPQHKSITDVKAAKPGAAIIVNGTFWDKADLGVADHTDGRIINNYTTLPISEDMTAGQAPEVKGWLGQRKDDQFSANAPNAEPPVPSAPYGNTDLRAAVGGVAALYPTYGGKSVGNIIDAISAEHGNWNDRQSNHIGYDSDDKVLFVITTYNAASDHYTPDIVLHETISALVDSGADLIRGLDGGQSVALAHRDREGNNLAIATAGDRHIGWFPNYVNNYVIITFSP
jgi:hypothetical protein